MGRKTIERAGTEIIAPMEGTQERTPVASGYGISKQLEGRQAKSRENDEIFAHVVRSLIEKRGVMLSVDRETPGHARVGKPKSEGQSKKIQIGDIEVDVHDPEAGAVIEEAIQEFRAARQHDAGDFAETEIDAGVNSVERTLESSERKIVTVEDRLAIERSLVDAQIDLMNVVLSPSYRDVALNHEQIRRNKEYCESAKSLLLERKIELEPMEGSKVPESITALREGNIPIGSAVLETLSSYQLSLREELEASEKSQGLRDATAEKRMRQRIQEIDEILSPYKDRQVREVSERMKVQRELRSFVIRRSELRGKPPAVEANLQADILLLTETEQPILPPREALCRHVYDEKKSIEEKLANVSGGEMNQNQEEVARLRDQARAMEHVWSKMTTEYPEEVARHTDHIDALRKVMSSPDLSPQEKSAAEVILDGKPARAEFTKYCLKKIYHAEASGASAETIKAYEEILDAFVLPTVRDLISNDLAKELGVEELSVKRKKDKKKQDLEAIMKNMAAPPAMT